MAYISHTYKFLFLSAPATGSSAIIKALQQKDIGQYHPQEDIVVDGRRLAPRKHTSVAQLKRQGLLDGIETYYRFVGIRNPFSWHVAKYLRNRTVRIKQAENPNSWINQLPAADRDRYVRQLKAQSRLSFPEYLEQAFEGKEPYEIQKEFHIGIDLFVHQERLRDDMETAKAAIGLPTDISVPVFNATNAMEEGRTYKDFYDQALIDLVHKYNAPFFNTFPEYSFDGISS